MILLRPKRWTDKPPVGAQINWGHPLLGGGIPRALYLMNEGVIGSLLSATRQSPFDYASQRGNVSLDLIVVQNQAGLALSADETSDNLQIGADSSWFPTTSCTIAMIRRKRDTILRAQSTFGVLIGGGSTDTVNTHCPYSDGGVHWDFGGNAGANRISYSWVATTQPEYFVFVAGSRGSAIYHHGVLQANQGTAITRTSNAGLNFYLNLGSVGGGDLQDFNFFMVLPFEWTASQAQWWSAEPYVFLLPQSPRIRYFFPSIVVAGDSSTTPQRMVAVNELSSTGGFVGRRWV